MAEHGHGHGHESAQGHGIDAWLGPKLKQFLKASGVTAFLSMVLFSTMCVPIVPAYIAGIGFTGGALSNWGWNAGQEKDKKKGHGGHKSHDGGHH